MVADISSVEAPRFMPLDAVRAGIPGGSSLRRFNRDSLTNDPIAPTLVGNGLPKPGFMPINRNMAAPIPSRGMPLMHVPVATSAPMPIEPLPSKPVPMASMPQKISKASPLLDLFDSRGAASNNFYDALRSKNGVR